ncbi:endoribonuclease L-PSP [Capronia epimyces CBS 606.96]|uniref:Endoribonuclease L-PSP n=1 Tax=Capronia epimyces CBS 606.96 TaxID=1182542 RepID=W9YS34_9EURO|nr:endoribonuclease L-PSP [Capronia epimyces CBS 606.96]EXJ85099.1 endoribonuclease L-PSP [Capronia epimyces CBS 606.96]
MAPKQPVVSEKGIKSPLFSQAIVHNGTVYVSGNIGLVPATGKIVEGSVADRTRQALENIKNVLEEAGSSLQNIVKINIFLTDMADYAAMNKAFLEIVPDPKPARSCVCVKELPNKTDVEIECIAHL